MESPVILIVDDDKDIVDAIEAILQMEEYEVTHAYEGRDGLKRAQKLKPSLILLDYMLPDMNGKEVTLALRKEDETKNIPVVLVSAAREAHLIAKELSVNGFIEKPFDMNTLLETVRLHVT